MSHLVTIHWHVFAGDPLAFRVTVESDAEASDVQAAEWRHPEIDTLTLDSGLSVSDGDDGAIVVDGDAGTPTLTAGASKEAHLLVDVGAGLMVVAVQRVQVSRRVDG